MAVGFRVKDSSGVTTLDSTKIGFQVVHEQTLTSQSNTVQFSLGDLATNPNAYIEYFWMSQTGYPQNVYTITDNTDYTEPFDGNYSLTVYVDKKGYDSYNLRFYIFAGDAYEPSYSTASL